MLLIFLVEKKLFSCCSILFQTSADNFIDEKKYFLFFKLCFIQKMKSILTGAGNCNPMPLNIFFYRFCVGIIMDIYIKIR